jgi:MFS family permease
MPDVKIEGWKISIFKELAIDWKFWLMMIYFFLMSGIFYVVIALFMPALKKVGFTDVQSIYLIGMSYVVTGILRFGSAWLGDKIGHWKLMLIGTLGMAGCYFLLPYNPVLTIWLFAPFSTMHTANYWAQCKQLWGPKYIATIIGIGYVAMYLGAGILYGKWAI